MWTYVYVAGVLNHRSNANDPGTDTEWGTIDDVITQVETYEHDARGLKTKWTQYSDPGTDGDFLTGDDDVISQYWSLAYNSDGILVDWRGFTEPGTDTEWGTPDDPIAWRFTFDIDSQGNRIKRTRWSDPGPDDDWANGNELSDYYEDFDTAN
jgi:hypothetical protein